MEKDPMTNEEWTESFIHSAQLYIGGDRWINRQDVARWVLQLVEKLRKAGKAEGLREAYEDLTGEIHMCVKSACKICALISKASKLEGESHGKSKHTMGHQGQEKTD